ncbi:molybdenum cofactor biosynthesis protein MoaE [Flavobacteriales bacterium]|nr:molybdenum cofactor biosynthesis protein MoaE [Flavobacteriales bacterium]
MIDNTANKKPKNVFIEGAISPKKIASSIAHHQVKTNIGAHDIFLGQVRADRINNETVRAIHYSCYEEMANEEFHQIREEAFSQFDLTCMHIYHSIGHVNAGEICLFVFTSSKHRKEAMDACRFLVEEIKKRVPIFGKELLADGKHVWKMNTPEDNK